MLYREIIAVCSQNHTKHINTLCGQKVELLNVKLAVHIVTTGRLGCYEHETRQQTCILLHYMESIEYLAPFKRQLRVSLALTLQYLAFCPRSFFFPPTPPRSLCT